MRKTCLFAFFSLGIIVSLCAQKNPITLEGIFGGAFRTEGLVELRSLNNGTQYTVLERNSSTGSTSIELYDYATLSKVGTIVSTVDLPELDGFSSYEFSGDESKIILATQVESIFRRSKLGVYFVFDRNKGKLTRIAERKIQEPTLSPDGSKVAYVAENNLFLLDITSEETVQITTDGVKNKVINGVTDWVYEEEFAFVKAFAWNSDGTKIAFLRFEETDVPEFSMDVYGQGLYQHPYVFKYPKAGEQNAKVSLHLHDIQSGESEQIDLGNPDYIPRIAWMHDPKRLSVQTINRHQNHLKLHAVHADNLEVVLLLEEKDDAYVDVTDNLTFLAEDGFIWTSERDGHNHIYRYDREGRLVNQVTKGDWEVTNYYGYDPAEDRVYYQSTENGSINRGVYSIGSEGRKKRALAVTAGTNAADFSADYSYFINTYSSAETPFRYTLYEARSGKKVRDIKDNEALSAKLEGYRIRPKEFSTISINGNELNMYMIKPVDFDESRKYPLFMFQYSGPGSQQVANRWMGVNDYWHQMLVDEGYVIACVDGRGTGFKGRDFKKVTQLELGKYEVQDQIDAAKKLSNLPYIDSERTGIWGWSYGGFMATNCILKGHDTFELAIAVAPVTSWRFYDTIYTERYMQTPQENARGYDENSPLDFAHLLEGDFLLVHGSADDNVHVQNTMRMVEALVQANKQFDWAIYPDKNHGISGGNTRLHLYTMMTEFIKNKL